MKQDDWLERIRKREIRTEYRNKRLEYESRKRICKKEKKRKKAAAREAAIAVLKNGNLKNRKTKKTKETD